MESPEMQPNLFADGEEPEVQVTTKKYSQFSKVTGPGIQGVGLKDGNNVRFDLTTDAIATNPDVILRDAKGRFRSADGLEDLTNQLKVNRFLANEVDLINEAIASLQAGSVVVQDDPPDIEADGQLWYSSNRLELFISYGGAWISTSPLESRIEAGEALQAEILARVEAGEAKQATIETNAMTKGGAQTLTEDHWSIKDDGGKTYAMIADEEITMYHVANPEAPKQPTNKEYVDNADKKMQTDISNLEAKVTELEGSIGEHRFIYNNEQSNPRDGNFVCKNASYEITDSTDDARYLEFGAKDVNDVPVDYSKIKAGDVLRLVGPAGERVEFNLEDVAESGTFLINGVTITGLDTFVNGIHYASTILSAFDPTGLASIHYVDTQDAKKLSLTGGTGSKMQGNLYMGSHFIAGVSEPTSDDHAATKKYADQKLPKTGGTMTGTLSMQRQDDVSYWNYIDSKTPKAWVGGDSEEAKATQKTHGLILKIGDTNSYKQQFKMQGRSNKDLLKIYDDGTGNFSFYGNVGVTGYLKQDGKDVLVDGENTVSTSFRLKNGNSTLLSTSSEGKIKIYHLADPTEAEHAANKKYVDDKLAGGGVDPYRHTHYFKVEERETITNGQVHYKTMGAGWLRFFIGTKTNGDFKYAVPNFDTVNVVMPFSIFYIEEGDLTETKFVFSGMTDSVRCYTSGETQAFYIEVDPSRIMIWQPNSVEDMKQVIVKIGSLTP